MRLVDEAAEVFERVDDHFFAAVSAFPRGGLAPRARARSPRPRRRSNVLGGSPLAAVIGGPQAASRGWRASCSTRSATRSVPTVASSGPSGCTTSSAWATSWSPTPSRSPTSPIDATKPELAAQWRTFVEQRTGRSGGGNYDGSVLAAVSNQVGLDARRAGELERAQRAHLEARACLSADRRHPRVGVHRVVPRLPRRRARRRRRCGEPPRPSAGRCRGDRRPGAARVGLRRRRRVVRRRRGAVGRRRCSGRPRRCAEAAGGTPRPIATTSTSSNDAPAESSVTTAFAAATRAWRRVDADRGDRRRESSPHR